MIYFVEYVPSANHSRSTRTGFFSAWWSTISCPSQQSEAWGGDESAAPQVNAGETCNIHTAPEEVPMEDTSDVVDEEGDIALPDEELEGLDEDFEDEVQ